MMMNLLRSLAIVLAIAAPGLAASINPYNSVIISTSAGTAVQNMTGYFKVAGSSLTPSTYTITLDGVTGSIRASSATLIYGIRAGTGTFTASGAAQYSVTTSSGISMASGCLRFSDGSYQCSASGATATVAAANVTAGTLGPNVIASSVAATTVVAGTYGNSLNSAQITIGPDGRIYAAANVLISGTGGGSSSIGLKTDNFTSQTNNVKTVFNLSTNISVSSGLFVFLDGFHQIEGVAYTFTPPNTITMTTAPATATSTGTAGFVAVYTVDIASGAQAMVLQATQTVSGTITFTQLIHLTSGAFAGAVLTSSADGTAYWAPASTGTSLSGVFLLASTNTVSATTTFTQQIKYSTGAFADAIPVASGTDGTLVYRTGAYVRNLIAADPILMGVVGHVISDPNGTPACIGGHRGCFMPSIDTTPRAWFISPYLINASTVIVAGTEAHAQMPIFTTTTVRNLTCVVNGVGGGGDAGTVTFRVRKNTANTALFCVMPSLTGTTPIVCSNAVDTVSFVPGDLISLTYTGSTALSQSANFGSCYFQMAF